MNYTTILKYLSNGTATLGGVFRNWFQPARLLMVFGVSLILVACGSDKGNSSGTTSGDGWSRPAGLADNISPDGENANDPQVAMGNNGNAIIVWAQHNPDVTANVHEIFKSEYRGGSWVHPTDLTADNISPATTAGGHLEPQVAMNDSGQAVIVWRGSDGIAFRTFVSDYNMTATGAWDHPASLTDNLLSAAATDALYQQVAMDNSGNTFVVWQQSNNTNTQIFKSDYNITTVGAWAPIPALSDSPLSPDGDNTNNRGLGAAMDNNGNALVAWGQHDTAGANRHEIFQSDYNITTPGVWNPTAFTDNINFAVGSAWYPQVAMNDSGQAVIVWREQNSPGGDFQIYRSDYNMTSPGAWSVAVNILAATAGWNADDPQVAIDNNGNAIIVWAQHNPAVSRHEIFKSEYRNGSWDDPADLNDNISVGGRGAALPQVAMGNNGNAVIVWEQYSGSTATCLTGTDTCKQIFKSEYRSGSWIHPADLTSASYISPDGWDASNSQVSMDDSGNAIIVWQQFDGANTQIFMSEYR